jgi:hypothetical protein
MAGDLFDAAAQAIEDYAGLDRLAARGTLRLSLKQAGLDPQKLSMLQLRAVFEKLMPSELEARGVADAVAVCHSAIAAIASAAGGGERPPESPDDIFRRLGGD